MSALPWIRRSHPDARFRLICIPYAGGGAAAFRSWAPSLPGDVDVCAVSLPGREARLKEAPYEAVGPLARDLARDLLPLLRAVPFALVGYSMGAWVAFELARELRRTRGPMPVHLIVCARRAPHLPSKLEPLYALPEDAFIAAVQERYGGIPAPILQNRELLRLFLPALRADFTLLDTYAYVDEPPLDVPISSFHGLDDATVSRREARAWQEHTLADFQCRSFPGGHFFLHDSGELLADAVAGRVASSR